jgi:hypothetical protein
MGAHGSWPVRSAAGAGRGPLGPGLREALHPAAAGCAHPARNPRPRAHGAHTPVVHTRMHREICRVLRFVCDLVDGFVCALMVRHIHTYISCVLSCDFHMRTRCTEYGIRLAARRIRVRVEIMGSQKCGIVGESQPVLMMIHPVISTRNRRAAHLRCAAAAAPL